MKKPAIIAGFFILFTTPSSEILSEITFNYSISVVGIITYPTVSSRLVDRFNTVLSDLVIWPVWSMPVGLVERVLTWRTRAGKS